MLQVHGLGGGVFTVGVGLSNKVRSQAFCNAEVLWVGQTGCTETNLVVCLGGASKCSKQMLPMLLHRSICGYLSLADVSASQSRSKVQ